MSPLCLTQPLLICRKQTRFQRLCEAFCVFFFPPPTHTELLQSLGPADISVQTYLYNLSAVHPLQQPEMSLCFLIRATQSISNILSLPTVSEVWDLKVQSLGNNTAEVGRRSFASLSRMYWVTGGIPL